MKVEYSLAIEDFVAYNLYFYEHNERSQKATKRLRWLSAALFLLIGLIAFDMMKSNAFRVVLIVMCLLFAALFAWRVPSMVKSSVKKNAEKLFAQAGGKRYTLALEEDALHSTGAGLDSRRTYGQICNIDEDGMRYYIEVDVAQAIVIPFRAFSSEEERKMFYEALIAHVNRVKEGQTD